MTIYCRFVSLVSAALVSVIIPTPLAAQSFFTQAFQDNSSVALGFESRDPASPVLTIALTSSTGVKSTLRATMQRGAFADYGLEVIARNPSVEFFGQCANLTPSVYIGRVSWNWSDNGTLQVLFTPTAGNSAVFGPCQSGGSFCQQADVSNIDEDLSNLIPSFEDEVSPGMCFAQSEPTSVDGDFLFPIPIPLADAECSAALASACWEPNIINQLIAVTADFPEGGVQRGGLSASLQRARRALSRALKSQDRDRLATTVREVRLTIRKALRGPRFLSVKTTNSLRAALTLLASSQSIKSGKIRRSISILRGVTSA